MALHNGLLCPQNLSVFRPESVNGVQPPNEKALGVTVGALAATALVWFGYERRKFQGPPQGVMIQQRQAEIEEAEKAVGELD